MPFLLVESAILLFLVFFSVIFLIRGFLVCVVKYMYHKISHFFFFFSP